MLLFSQATSVCGTAHPIAWASTMLGIPIAYTVSPPYLKSPELVPCATQSVSRRRLDERGDRAALEQVELPARIGAFDVHWITHRRFQRERKLGHFNHLFFAE
jgi:hypothetical protein